MAEVRFQLDEHVPHAVAYALRRDGIDVITTTDAGLVGQPDSVQLAYAHAERRVMFTRDTDFLSLSRHGAEHSGIVFRAQQSRSIGQIVVSLRRIHRTLDADEMLGEVQFI